MYDVDPDRRRERERQMAIRSAEADIEGKDARDRPKEDVKAEASSEMLESPVVVADYGLAYRLRSFR